jgi:hypothetical protein
MSIVVRRGIQAAEHRLINVCRRREVDRVAANIDSIFWLVYSNIVNIHMDWEGNVFYVDSSKVRRGTQIHKQVL